MKDWQPSIAIIGTGYSGLCAAIRVKQELGIIAQVFEMDSEVGGTWNYNTYPGCACDIPSHLYSLSFELNANWSEHYSSQPEIFQYLRGVARKHRLYDQIRFNTEVVSLEWLDERQQWKLKSRTTNNEQTTTNTEYFNFVIAGLGPLRIPKVPREVTGFSGKTVHTAAWDHSVDFKGKKVAVVGSGASAVQVIPELQKIAKQVVSFQRTPCWIFPRTQFRYPRIIQLLLYYVPFLMRFYRNALFIQHEMTFPIFGYSGTLLGKITHAVFKHILVSKLKKLKRPDLIPVLLPNYAPGCKRVAKADNYLAAVAQSNVTVIPSAVKEVQGQEIVAVSGEKEKVDILVLATGFDVLNYMGNLKVIGRKKKALDEHWKDSYPSNYKIITVNDFPNFFLALGPGSGVGHNSVVVIIECQIEFSIKCIKYAIKNNIASLEPKISAQNEFTNSMKKQFKTTAWNSGCKSYYLNQKGEVVGVWPSTLTKFWWMTLNPGFKNFSMVKRK